MGVASCLKGSSAAAASLAGASLGAFASRLRHRKRRVQRAAGPPVDYYGLLGLPRFTSDTKQIKSAFRRVVRLVHPDVLGSDSQALQILVTEAYATLTDDEKRERYDDLIASMGEFVQRSKWSPDAPYSVKGLFVDQTKCQGCGRCTEIASSSFESDVGEGTSRVVEQFADCMEMLEQAVDGCPSKAIRWVNREDLPFLEGAMGEWIEKRRSRDIRGSELSGPYETFQQFQFMRLDAMDFGSADGARKVAEQADRLASEVAGQSDHAQEIAEAAMSIPADVVRKVWPQMEKGLKDAARTEPSGGLRDPDLRVQLVKAVFQALDDDEDGWLREREMRRFGELAGFEGDDRQWAEEYRLMCSQNYGDPSEGVGEILLLKLVEGDCFCTTEELLNMLETLQEEAQPVENADTPVNQNWQLAGSYARESD